MIVRKNLFIGSICNIVHFVGDWEEGRCRYAFKASMKNF